MAAEQSRTRAASQEPTGCRVLASVPLLSRFGHRAILSRCLTPAGIAGHGKPRNVTDYQALLKWS